VAIYHIAVKTVSRSAGRSATGAAAYRAAARITDHRTGLLHDYTRKGGVESSELLLPANAPEWAVDRSALWNAAEQSETRKNSTVAREFEIALPSELSAEGRRQLATDYAREIVERHGCAADVSIHAPGKEGDHRNHHAHILVTTRRLGPEGFGEKTRELDDKKTKEVDHWRGRFAELQNERLREAGSTARVDHRSLAAQGIEREPTKHLGPTASAIERRTGEPSQKRLAAQRDAAERLAKAQQSGEQERALKAVDRQIIDLSGDLARAKELAKQERMLQSQLSRTENSVALAEKSGMVITAHDRHDVRAAQDELGAFRKQHDIEPPAAHAQRADERTKLGDTAQDRLRAAREAGERERGQPGQVQRDRVPDDPQERLRLAREAGERERAQETERPRERDRDDWSR